MSPQLVFLIRGQVLALSGKDLEEKIVCTGHQEAGSHPLEAPGVPSPGLPGSLDFGHLHHLRTLGMGVDDFKRGRDRCR